MNGDEKIDRIRLNDYDDPSLALMDANDVALDIGIKLYVLSTPVGTYRVDDQFDDESDIVDEALP